MSFPIIHPFRTEGVYINKIDPESFQTFTRQSDGSLKPYKQSLVGKLFEFATTKRVALPYGVLLVREEFELDYSSGQSRMKNPHLEIFKATVTGELYGIINSYKNKRTFPDLFRHKIVQSEGSQLTWQAITNDSKARLEVRNSGSKVVLSSIDVNGKPYTTDYHFMQWEA